MRTRTGFECVETRYLLTMGRMMTTVMICRMMSLTWVSSKRSISTLTRCHFVARACKIFECSFMFLPYTRTRSLQSLVDLPVRHVRTCVVTVHVSSLPLLLALALCHRLRRHHHHPHLRRPTCMHSDGEQGSGDSSDSDDEGPMDLEAGSRRIDAENAEEECVLSVALLRPV